VDSRKKCVEAQGDYAGKWYACNLPEVRKRFESSLYKVLI
jgi:hypothetical protein